MNDINTLRQHLFDAIEGVKNKTMSIEQAKTISEIGQTVINTAKVEVEYSKATGGNAATVFLTGNTAPGVTVHRLRG